MPSPSPWNSSSLGTTDRCEKQQTRKAITARWIWDFFAVFRLRGNHRSLRLRSDRRTPVVGGPLEGGLSGGLVALMSPECSRMAGPMKERHPFIPPKEQPSEPPVLVNQRTAAAMLGVCENTIYALVKDGRLPAKRLHSRKLFDPNDLRAFATRLPAYDCPRRPRSNTETEK